jgi:hypothetical protein
LPHWTNPVRHIFLYIYIKDTMLTLTEPRVKKVKEPKISEKRKIFLELSLSANVYESRQRRPYTYVRVHAWYMNKEYWAIGFSKVNWPDAWSEEYGVQMARDHALGDIVKQIRTNNVHAET